MDASDAPFVAFAPEDDGADGAVVGRRSLWWRFAATLARGADGARSLVAGAVDSGAPALRRAPTDGSVPAVLSSHPSVTEMGDRSERASVVSFACFDAPPPAPGALAAGSLPLDQPPLTPAGAGAHELLWIEPARPARLGGRWRALARSRRARASCGLCATLLCAYACWAIYVLVSLTTLARCAAGGGGGADGCVVPRLVLVHDVCKQTTTLELVADVASPSRVRLTIHGGDAQVRVAGARADGDGDGGDDGSDGGALFSARFSARFAFRADDGRLGALSPTLAAGASELRARADVRWANASVVGAALAPFVARRGAAEPGADALELEVVARVTVGTRAFTGVELRHEFALSRALSCARALPTDGGAHGAQPVAYTHLTLPTKRIV